MSDRLIRIRTLYYPSKSPYVHSASAADPRYSIRIKNIIIFSFKKNENVYNRINYNSRAAALRDRMRHRRRYVHTRIEFFFLVHFARSNFFLFLLFSPPESRLRRGTREHEFPGGSARCLPGVKRKSTKINVSRDVDRPAKCVLFVLDTSQLLTTVAVPKKKEKIINHILNTVL